MVEQLWAKVSSRNQIMEIAENLIPYFKSQKKDEYGNSARFASIQDIDFDQVVIGDVNNIKIKVKVLSDQGDWLHDMIIREFKEIDLLEEEIKRYNELERRCVIFDNIFPSPLIHIDRENKQLIYEYNTGKLLSDLQLDDELVNYQLGRIFAMIQGEKSNPLDAVSIRDLLDYILNGLPFTDQEREKVAVLLEPHYIILPNCLGGYVPCTLFDPTTIEFSELLQHKITKSDIMEDRALYLTIPMQLPENNIVDRMADIASFFIENTYKEFCNTGDVTYNRQQIAFFFEGYNSVARMINMPTMQQLYPHGITLDLQMLIIFWIFMFTKMSTGEKNWDADAVRFTYFLLLKKPFLLF